MFEHRPSFGTYLWVIRYQRALWLKTVSTAAFGLSLYLSKGTASVAVAVLIVLGLGVVWFPIWRRYVRQHPESWTSGNPQLLDEDWR